MSKTIFIFSNQEWQSLPTKKRFVLLNLSKRNRILFLPPAIWDIGHISLENNKNSLFILSTNLLTYLFFLANKNIIIQMKLIRFIPFSSNYYVKKINNFLFKLQKKVILKIILYLAKNKSENYALQFIKKNNKPIK